MIKYLSAALLSLCCLLPASADDMTLLGVGTTSKRTTSYLGPADVVASPLLFYGLRAMSASYAIASGKLVNLARSSDSHACDVQAALTGGMGVTTGCGTAGDNGQTAASFCSSTSCRVVTLYDQSGKNGCGSVPCDVSSVSNGPIITFNCVNTLPCMTYSSGKLLSRGSSPTQAQPLTVSQVFQRTGSCGSTNCDVFNSNTIGIATHSDDNDNNWRMAAPTGQTCGSFATINTFLTVQAIFNAGSSTAYNGSSNACGGSPGTNGLATNLWIGSTTAPNYMNGNIEEVGIWASGFTAANSKAMCNNQKSYYALGASCT